MIEEMTEAEALMEENVSVANRNLVVTAENARLKEALELAEMECLHRAQTIDFLRDKVNALHNTAREHGGSLTVIGTAEYTALLEAAEIDKTEELLRPTPATTNNQESP